jgi:PIN domain nuclease of toxin-antitoxin system
MRLLLDTHALLWLDWQHPQMRATTRALLVDPRNTILLSPVTYWEIAILLSRGRLTH